MSRTAQRGFTLMELMVVVLIVAILAAVALPTYFDSVRKSNRTIAKTKLLELAGRQEQYFADNKVYTNDLTLLGVGANPTGVNSKGTFIASSSAASLYTISAALSNSNMSFTLTADTANSQTKDDANCATLTLSETGARGGTGGMGASCWD
jgi:type IV pilus assembly protein PilE